MVGYVDHAGNNDLVLRLRCSNKMGKNQSNWMRLFMVPGMGHCGGGPGVNTFDQIGTLEKWVEKGIAPDQIMGTGQQGTLTRPLCPYPQYAEYKGSGDLKSAMNWACKAPASKRRSSNRLAASLDHANVNPCEIVRFRFRSCKSHIRRIAENDRYVNVCRDGGHIVATTL